MTASVRWGGDFSLPRFRAKLANKYLLHPDVEPYYSEVYKSEIGQHTILRKDATESPSFSLLSGSRFLESPSGRLDVGASLASLSSVDPSRSSWNTSTNRPVRRQASVPTLGLRRVEVPPASMHPPPPGTQPLPMLRGGRSTSGSTGLRDAPQDSLQKSVSMSSLTLTMPQSPAAPGSPSAAEAKSEESKDKAIEAACKQLWVAAHGSEVYFKQQLILMKSDPKASGLGKMPMPGAINKAMKLGAKIDWRCEEWDGATLLLKAVRSGSLELAMYLLSVGADPTVQDRSGRNALHWAAFEGNAQMMEWVLTNMPMLPLEEGDGFGDGPLHLAAFSGHLPVVRLLVREQADPDVVNTRGFSAVEMAKSGRMWHVLRYFEACRQLEEDKLCRDCGKLYGKDSPVCKSCGRRRDKVLPGLVLSGLDRACNQHRATELREIGLEPALRTLQPVVNVELLARDDMAGELKNLAAKLASS